MYQVNQKQAGKWYSLTANQANRHADLYLFGVIGGDNANIQQFLADLQSVGDVDTLTVHLNTVGGLFSDGLPIYNTLKQHKARVTVKVMGYALSIGSLIMLAGDTIEAAENSLIMLHRAQGIVWGDAGEMRKAAEVLEMHEQAIAPVYAARMGIATDDVQAILNAETWYSASAAKAAGLVDTITGTTDSSLESAKMCAEGRCYVTDHYHNLPQQLITKLTQEDNAMTPEDIQAIATAAATAVVKAMKEQNTDNAEIAELKTALEKAKQEAAANAAAANELAELKKTVPNNADAEGVVAGPAGSSARRWL
jgi:ATP-dependent protease ClpP protease subunit